MNGFFAFYKKIFPHILIVFSFVLTAQWILTLFNPNLGLISMHNPVCCIELIVYFLLCFFGGLLYLIDVYRK